MSTTPLNHTRLQAALEQPNGARFYKCALQVNPWTYVQNHDAPAKTAFPSEAAYNDALVAACLEAGIHVVGVTDHFRIGGSAALIRQLEKAGITVFPGFEAETSDGIHVLCLFDPGRSLDEVKAAISHCGFMGEVTGSPAATCDFSDLLKLAHGRWGAECIAAHVTHRKGLLQALQGQARAAAWKHPALLAAAIPGPLDEMDQKYRSILKNDDAATKREHPVALVNASDVSSPDDLRKPGAWCWIKMSSISVEGLRQAFLDEKSRIRFGSQPREEPPRTELRALTWESGFFDGVSVHLNPNLNVFIGGRGSGKSTVIESVRYVLDRAPLGEDAAKAHQGIVQRVLKAGAKLSLLVRSSHPVERNFIIERTVPNPPVVKDTSGAVMDLTPRDLVPDVHIFGQHEISEVAKHPEKRTRLIESFTASDPSRDVRKQELRRELERSRARVLETRRELQDLQDRSALLPGLEERNRRYEEAGLEEKLKEKTTLDREQRVLRAADERLRPFAEALASLKALLPIDQVFLTPTALDALPGGEVLAPLREVAEQFEARVEAASAELGAALDEATSGIHKVRETWSDERKKPVEAAYEQLLRELQKSKVDTTELVNVRRQIEEIRPLREREATLRTALKEMEHQRRTLLDEWQGLLGEETRALEATAKRLTKQLAPFVKVEVKGGEDRAALRRVLSTVKGLRGEALSALQTTPGLSVLELAATCRQGSDALAQRYGLTRAMAERVCGGSEELFLALEEVELRPTTSLSLNTAATADEPSWQTLDALSTGQKATAILMVLLQHDDEAPLIVDQPEDDLDNRFIMDGVVNRMRDAKRRRQFLFATHNANIPVLGDAELIVGLTPTGEGSAHIAPGHAGSIDDMQVQELVENILEGGKQAFEMRRRKYGFR